MNGIDNGMGPGPGRSASDYSGSPELRYCIGCGCEIGMHTPAQWAEMTDGRLCGTCQEDDEAVAYWERHDFDRANDEEVGA